MLNSFKSYSKENTTYSKALREKYMKQNMKKIEEIETDEEKPIINNYNNFESPKLILELEYLNILQNNFIKQKTLICINNFTCINLLIKKYNKNFLNFYIVFLFNNKQTQKFCLCSKKVNFSNTIEIDKEIDIFKLRYNEVLGKIKSLLESSGSISLNYCLS